MAQAKKFLAIAVDGVALSEDLTGIQSMAVYAKQTKEAYQEEWPQATYALGDTAEAAEAAALAKAA